MHNSKLAESIQLMNLYKRNYLNGLIKDEKAEYDAILFEERSGMAGNVRRNLYHKYPSAVRKWISLFPNNYLDFVEIKNNVGIFQGKNDMFLKLLSTTKSSERDIINFIKNETAFHIIGSILRGCALRIGHHGAYLFPEFQLGSSFQADYLIIGNNSGGYEFVFVELESPRATGNKKITTKNGDLGGVFRDGINQVEDWDQWLQGNYHSLSDYFYKQIKPKDSLPKEFSVFDISRMHYVVVAGMRNDFHEKTYLKAREYKDNRKIHLLHYENLYDFASEIFEYPTY